MKTLLILLLCTTSFLANGQDERFYRSIFARKGFRPSDAFPHKIKVESPRYTLDLNRDGIEDSFQTVKKDGVDFIRINNHEGQKIFEEELLTKGKKSHVFKAHLRSINKSVDVLILHYYEGDNEAVGFEGSARLYFLTIRDKSLNKITLRKGPHFWTERESVTGRYWNKRYSVNVLDYNSDGQNEISVSYNNLSRVYFYLRDGKWSTL